MTELAIWQIDAFTREPLRGNPAAVVPLDAWLDDATLQAIAAENNLAETAFFVPEATQFHLRWFTPTVEVRLCGHATLASAFVLFEELAYERDEIRFRTLSGELAAGRAGSQLSLQFPRWHLVAVDSPPAMLTSGLDTEIVETRIVSSRDNYFVVLPDEEAVAALAPDLARLAELHPAGVIVTAPGRDSDCVCRYFAPSYGIPEDPVTGSIHCAIAPYWAERLGRDTIRSRQLSPRGGELECVVRPDATEIRGSCVKYLEGQIFLR